MVITISRPVLIDTRERAPWFQGPVEGFEFTARREGLKTGDYSLAGLQDRILVERKSVSDLLGCIGHGRDRFEAMLARMHETTVEPWLIVEGSRHELETGQHRSRISPASVVGSLMAWSCDYQVTVWWASTAQLAERDVLRLFKRVENRVKVSHESD